MTNKTPGYHPARYLAAWAVHIFTASAACLGLFTLLKIYQHNYVQALWLMGFTVVIDSVDGSLARLVHVKTLLPNIDGTLLDNIVDYLNYVITPCFFLYIRPDMLPTAYLPYIIIAIIIASSYQFCQADAKTPDHFFKGFPCYWNIAVFYMFIFDTTMTSNALILAILCVFIFVPVKYVYPSRLDYLTKSKALKLLMHSFSLIYGVSSALILWNYPQTHSIWLVLSTSYVALYLILSFYRTCSPMIKSRITANREYT